MNRHLLELDPHRHLSGRILSQVTDRIFTIHLGHLLELNQHAYRFSFIPRLRLTSIRNEYLLFDVKFESDDDNDNDDSDEEQEDIFCARFFL